MFKTPKYTSVGGAQGKTTSLLAHPNYETTLLLVLSEHRI